MKRDGLKHLSSRERKALAEYLTRLGEQLGDRVQHVILYGSKVRGDFYAESDIDLFVVIKDPDLELEDLLTRLSVDVDLKYDVLLADFVVPQERFERMAQIREPLYQSVVSEGVELWTRPSKSLLEFDSKKPRTMSRSRPTYSTKANIGKRSVARTMRSLQSPARRSSPNK